MNDDKPVTRREIDQRFTSLREHLDNIYEHHNELHESESKALILQRTIDEEHFQRLNGEAGRIQVVLSQSIPRETFELFKEENRLWRESVTKQMSDDRDTRRRELATESESRRKELSGEVRPLQNAAQFDAGRWSGVLLALGAGAAVGGLILKLAGG